VISQRQNLSHDPALSAILFVQNALPDYCLNDGPDNSSRHLLKEMPE